MKTLKQKIKEIKWLYNFLLKVYRLFKGIPESYAELGVKLEQKDRQCLENNKELAPLHDKLNSLKRAQEKEWNSLVYCGGYYYQGYRRICINGIKPTEDRIENYEILEYFSKEKTVLDIGSNAGFMVCYLSEFFKEVDGIELNPYLINMGNETANFLNINNVNFLKGDFVTYEFSKKYDIIFSLSNHFTIDGNLNIGFESYIEKLFNNISINGILAFESHNINGDDSDLNDKFKIASKYFKLIKYKMVKSYFPQDIDKLFAVFIRLDEKKELPEKINFDLDTARKKYNY